MREKLVSIARSAREMVAEAKEASSSQEEEEAKKKDDSPPPVVKAAPPPPAISSNPAAAVPRPAAEANPALNHLRRPRHSGAIPPPPPMPRLDPHAVMCRFELAGRCNDDQCGFQHSAPRRRGPGAAGAAAGAAAGNNK